ncbi:MAG: hypothetical protein KA151_03150 [Piscinibacter sp.]|nr:hypothetical protein [Piscinibacter sp.]
MNNSEGIARLSKVCHWTGIAGALYFGGRLVAEMRELYPDDDTMISHAISTAACYALGRAAAWVVSGFASPK